MTDNSFMFPNTSLYVGDLDPDVTEAQLFERFSPCGQIVLIKICRDKITRQSLGYAYVNFSQPADAERALDTLNFELLNSKPMRLMWSNRDPALRRSGLGNVFIKNLDKSIDNKSLYDTFSTFGNIISCKIMSDETGSKGYGFVHFETQEAADKAINSVNNMILNGKIVYVGQFISKCNRSALPEQLNKKFTNIFVKNFANLLDEKKLKDLFSKYGEMTSVKVSKTNDGQSAGFGFINFKEPESAIKAVQEMNEHIIEDKRLYVSKFQKKSERITDLKKKYEEKKLEQLKKYQGINLFIKNLDDKIDNERLRKDFQPFGTITSARVMTENGRSKGFGFVCYTLPEEASRALAEMNGRIVGTKPLFVTLAQRKEDRKKILTAQFRERLQNNQFANASSFNPSLYYALQNANSNLGPGTALAGARYIAAAAASSNYITNQQHIRTPAVPRWQLTNYQRTPFITENLYNQQNYTQQLMDSISLNQLQQQRNQRAQQINNAFVRNVYSTSPQKNTSQNLAQVLQSKATKIKQLNIPGQEPLTLAELSAAQPQQQKQMLGERLYPLIFNLNQEYAGKITGMLLEIDNAELLHMLESEDSLKSKVEEALSVLQTHHEKIHNQKQQKQIQA